MARGVLILLGYIITVFRPHHKVVRRKSFGPIQEKKSWIIASIFALYLSGIILTMYKGAGMLTPAILFYGITLTGTGFLSILLWFDQKEKITLSLAVEMILLILSGSLLAVKLFVGNTCFIEDIKRLCYISA